MTEKHPRSTQEGENQVRPVIKSDGREIEIWTDKPLRFSGKDRQLRFGEDLSANRKPAEFSDVLYEKYQRFCKDHGISGELFAKVVITDHRVYRTSLRMQTFRDNWYDKDYVYRLIEGYSGERDRHASIKRINDLFRNERNGSIKIDGFYLGVPQQQLKNI